MCILAAFLWFPVTIHSQFQNPALGVKNSNLRLYLFLNPLDKKYSEDDPMLRGIRVRSKEELMRRIYRYFDEVNE